MLVKRLGPHLVGLTIMLAGVSYGNDEHGLYRIRGIGSSSCGRYVKTIDRANESVEAENDRYAFLSWVSGYLSHYNHESDGVYDIFGLQICQLYSFGFITIVAAIL